MQNIYLKIKHNFRKIYFSFAKAEIPLVHSKAKDPLIGFSKRKQLIKYFDHLVAHSPDKEKAILAINIDRFHSINDLFGRNIGDQVILKLTELVRLNMYDFG